MVKLSDLLNSSILNSEWVGFQGDSEFMDREGNYQLGYWEFVDTIEDTHGQIPWELDDEVDEDVLFKRNIIFIIRNKKDHICMVKFHYRRLYWSPVGERTLKSHFEWRNTQYALNMHKPLMRNHKQGIKGR